MNTAKEWLEKEGYPSFMPMSIENLEIILERYAASQSVATPEAEIEKRILDAYYAGFNQSHYSHVHPETFPAKTCEYGGAEYWDENKKYILAAIKVEKDYEPSKDL
jgi:hypothetical protein